METLITGCERSGTKLLSKVVSDKQGRDVCLENKHTIASFRYWQELQRWNRYGDYIAPTLHTTVSEKHSLTMDINIEFLKWCKKMWADMEIHYIVRDGRHVVGSMINRVWGGSQHVGTYSVSLHQACKMWNHVISTTYDWAIANCKMYRYEDISDVVSNPLTDPELEKAIPFLMSNLKKTGYE
jgi:hypothetical protein